MWKINSICNSDIAPFPHAPCGTREISESIDGNGDCLIKGAHVEGRGQVRKMMFYMVEVPAESLVWERPGQKCGYPFPRPPVLQAAKHQARIRALRDKIYDLPSKISPS